MSPELTTHPLRRADGSATLSTELFTIVAGVNGPVEVSRRDELPEEAAIEITIRPSAGIGGPRERWLETLLASLLKSILLVHMHPRTLIQVTLQIVKEPVGVKLRRREGDVAVIADLANAAFLALVDAGLPLQSTVVGALAVVREGEGVVVGPNEKQLVGCKNLHAMVFNQEGEMLLDESAGVFSMEQWQRVYDELRTTSVAAMAGGDGDEAMADNALSTPWLRKALEERVRAAGVWREDG